MRNKSFLRILATLCIAATLFSSCATLTLAAGSPEDALALLQTVEALTAGEDTAVEDVIDEGTVADDVIDEGTVADDVTVEDTAVEDVTVEDTAAEDVTVEDIAAEDTTVEDIAADETDGEDAIEAESATVGTSSDSATVDAGTGWVKSNGKSYYYDANGVKVTGLYVIKEEVYLFDTNGAMKTGWQDVKNGEETDRYYFDPDSGEAWTGLQEISSKYYYFGEEADNQGIMQKGFVTAPDGKKYYLGSDGTAVTGWKTINGKTYFFGETRICALTGLWKISGNYYFFSERAATSGQMLKNGIATASDGSKYYVNANGVAQDGWKTVNGNKYYFGYSTKKALTGLWNIDDEMYYFNSDGVMHTGWQTVGDETFYFNLSTGAAETGWVTIDGSKYYFNTSTHNRMTGLRTISNNKYYFNSDGVMQTGWKTINGSKYYFQKSGAAASNWLTVSGKKYYFDSSTKKMLTGLQEISGNYYFFSLRETTLGQMLKNGIATAPDGKKYYLNSSGVAQSGWKTVSGKTYYFGATSKAALTGVWTLGSNMYLFDANGVRCSGSGLYTAEDGSVYYLSKTVLKTGWVTVDGSKYYFSTSTGKMLTGLQKIDSNYYYFSEDASNPGVMQTSGWYTDSATGIRCFLEDDGKAATGWVTDANGNKYYLNSATGGLATGLTKIGSNYYYFSEREATLGKMLKNGIATAQDGKKYYLNASGIAQTGWKTVGGKTYFFGETRICALTGAWNLGSNMYLFDDNGVRCTGNGFYTAKDGSVYYLSNSLLKTGWIKDNNGDYYYFSTSTGKMLTGLNKIGSYYYFFDEDTGIMQTGLVTAKNGDKYYLNASGTAYDGWKTFTNSDGTEHTYYFGYSTKKALTGLWNIDGYKYYFSEDTETLGDMLTGYFKTVDGVTYFFRTNGRAKTGWLTLSNRTYYFDIRTNAMLTGWQTIDGNCYYFGSNGRMVTNTTVDGYAIGSDGKASISTRARMILTAQSYSSKTKYLLLTDTTNCKVGVFTGSQGNWDLLYYWDCNCGDTGHETPLGTFAVESYSYTFGNDVYTSYYGTAFYTITGQAQWLFHSILYVPGTMTPQDGRLGVHSSNGCIRLALANCKWIYNNCGIGTTVVNYS